MLLTQKVAFNSPVWFNVGCDRLEPDADGQNWHWDAPRAACKFPPPATGIRNARPASSMRWTIRWIRF
jgi:ribonucleoside-diphosphate reductase alpha chain